MSIIKPTRRGLITGLAALIAAPAVVRAAALMPVKAWVEPGFPYDGLHPAYWALSVKDGDVIRFLGYSLHRTERGLEASARLSINGGEIISTPAEVKRSGELVGVSLPLLNEGRPEQRFNLSGSYVRV
jgi:hypothetical protein